MERWLDTLLERCSMASSTSRGKVATGALRQNQVKMVGSWTHGITDRESSLHGILP